MRFVTNNVNVILMSAIVLIAIFGVAYYHYQEVKFQEVNEENEQLKAEVAQLEANLSNQEERLREIFGELQNRLEDTVQFENLYGEVTQERDTLETQLASLEDKYAQERSRRITAEQEVNQLVSQVGDLEAEKQQLQSTLTTCSEELDTCEAACY